MVDSADSLGEAIYEADVAAREAMPEFAETGMNEVQHMAAMLRYHAREARVFDTSNDTVVVTRRLLLSGAETIEQLLAALKEAYPWMLSARAPASDIERVRTIIAEK